MVYDPAFGMPKPNWVQQGSFVIPELPPTTEPDAAPLICLPPINQYWLPFVMGALDQLRNPSSWLVADDDAMFNTLARVARLKEMLGVGTECTSSMIRFDGSTCQLQESVDGGTTWMEVDGWEDFNACLPPQTLVDYDSGCTLNQSLDGGMTYQPVPGWIDSFSQCVQKYMPIIGLPPNPGDQSPDQLACSIATYLAEQVIVAAMGKAVTAISDDLTLLQFGLDVVNIIPEFVLVTLAADAFSAIYVAVQEGTLSDFEDALTDSDLLTAVKCAIFGCIAGDGYVTPSNFSCITAAVAAISYSHSDVIEAIGAYLTALGAVGLAQLSQVAGLEQGADCSACGDICRMWDFSTGPNGFGQGPDEIGGWSDGFWHSQPVGANNEIDIVTSQFNAEYLASVRVVGGSSGVSFGIPCTFSIINPVNGDCWDLPPISDPFDVTVDIGEQFTSGFRIRIATVGGTGTYLSLIQVFTTGTAAGGNALVGC